VKFLSHPGVETRISHTAKNRNCAVSLVRNTGDTVTTEKYSDLHFLLDYRESEETFTRQLLRPNLSVV